LPGAVLLLLVCYFVVFLRWACRDSSFAEALRATQPGRRLWFKIIVGTGAGTGTATATLTETATSTAVTTAITANPAQTEILASYNTVQFQLIESPPDDLDTSVFVRVHAKLQQREAKGQFYKTIVDGEGPPALP